MEKLDIIISHTWRWLLHVSRRASTETKQECGIFVKHFKNIPMADMEIVLPEKKNPSLTPMDWVKFLISVVLGLVTLVSSLERPKADIWVVIAILSGLVGYCAKIYFTFQQSMVLYQNLITKSVYDKQLDSGKGTLLHLCDDVIQQEVKEVIISYFILLEQGKATEQVLPAHVRMDVRLLKTSIISVESSEIDLSDFQDNEDGDGNRVADRETAAPTENAHPAPENEGGCVRYS